MLAYVITVNTATHLSGREVVQHPTAIRTNPKVMRRHVPLCHTASSSAIEASCHVVHHLASHWKLSMQVW